MSYFEDCGFTFGFWLALYSVCCHCLPTALFVSIHIGERGRGGRCGGRRGDEGGGQSPGLLWSHILGEQSSN